LSKKKSTKHTTKLQHKLDEKAAEPIYTKQFEKKFRYLILIPVLLSIAAAVYLIYSAYKTNGFFGFPLDDPWIHLTFAKNLIEYGSFSYFKNELVTSGSTSPIYTLLLSLFYIVSKNEFIISYLIGVMFGALIVYMINKLSLLNFKNSTFISLLAASLIALQPRLNLINVSGMETSMFIFLIAGGFYSYQKGKIIPLGIFLGLTIWCRPDGFVLWIAIVLDYLIRKFYLTKSTSPAIDNNLTIKEFVTAISLASVLVFAYFLFNYLLSGSILPNTYNAKIEYYNKMSRTQFLENDVLKYFTEAEFILIWLPFLIYTVIIIKSMIKREYNTQLVFLLFIIGLITIYYLKLPFAHRFGRYLLPVIPFYILIYIAGVKSICDFIFKKISNGKTALPNLVFIIYSIAAVGLFTNYNSNSKDDLTFMSKYSNDRHVAAGKWLKQNTPESAIIATHDIGAIGFYGERKIIDLAGLVTPELIAHLEDKNYAAYMNDYLSKQKVDYLVTLRNWFEVVNDKPIYTAINSFEFLDIFKFNPGRTHILLREVSEKNLAALQMIQKGIFGDAIVILQQSLSLDRQSSQTHFLLGAAYAGIKDYPNAEKHFKYAIELFPDFAEAYFGLSKVYYEQKKFDESLLYVKTSLEIDPNFTAAIQLLMQFNSLNDKNIR
jgi:tetratricopeptide (TPR) repeat protein